MPIYSSNRIKSVTEGYRAAPGYDMNDFGRILVECAINDRAIFEAVLVSDIAEATAIRSGKMTLREAEEEGSNKLQGAIDAVTSMLEKFLEKVKGILETARNKIGELFARNNKIFNAVYKKRVEDYFKESGKNEIKLAKEIEYFPNGSFTINDSEFIKKVYTFALTTINKDSWISKADPDAVKESIHKCTKTTDVISSSNINELIKGITDGSSYISDLRKIERDFENDAKEKIKQVKSYTSKSKEDKDNFEMVRSRVNAYTVYVTTVLNASITGTLEVIRSTRAGLVEAAHKASGHVEENASVLECAMCWLESDAEVDEVIKAPATDSETSDDNTSENNDKDINIDVDPTDGETVKSDEPTEVNVNITIEN